MKHIVTKVHPDDNVIVALKDLKQGDKVTYNGNTFTISK